MNEEPITTVAQFHERLQVIAQLTSDDTGSEGIDPSQDKKKAPEWTHIYRGQSDAGWQVDCSLVRRLTPDLDGGIDPQKITYLLSRCMKSLVDRAKMRGFIQSDSKIKIREELETIYGINEEGLFSDLSGYAVANAANNAIDPGRIISFVKDDEEKEKQTIKTLCEAYHDRGLARYQSFAVQDAAGYVLSERQKGYLKDAIKNFDTAIGFDDQHASAYYYRGVAKEALKKDGIEDLQYAEKLAKEQGDEALVSKIQEALETFKE